MCGLKIIVLTLCIWHVSAVLMKDQCQREYEFPAEWKSTENDTLGPGKMKVVYDKNANEIRATFVNGPKDVWITALIKPTDNAYCPKTLEDAENLFLYNQNYVQRSNTAYKASKNAEKLMTIPKPITGCYYFNITDENGTNWLYGGQFYNTSNPHIDPHPKCKLEYYPPGDTTKESVNIRVTVPTLCRTLALCVISHNGSRTGEECDWPRMVEQFERDTWDDCEDTVLGDEWTNCTLREQSSKLQAKQYIRLNHSEWIVDVTREEESECNSNRSYYVSIYTIIGQCRFQNKPVDYYRWQPFISDEVFRFTPPRACNYQPTEDSPYSLELVATILPYVALGAILVGILLHWIRKYNYLIAVDKLNKERHNGKSQRAPEQSDDGASKGILLVYTKGSLSFMDKMENFRNYLRLACGCRVYDLQSQEDEDDVATYGATEWIGKLLLNGSKVIFVDTPEFRSMVNGIESDTAEEREPVVDSRDLALRYAVESAKNVQDPSTQYCQHFVVRWDEIKTTDDWNDPLSLIAPHIRFNLPENFGTLCEYIRNSMGTKFNYHVVDVPNAAEASYEQSISQDCPRALLVPFRQKYY
ncbi:uncharacterized protein LOC124178494 isoform X1 [Neodiprion fabricii]|uniref:uncharacterized protein LOC124178494 isoform X1 n=2 Tax=Neodiprion fabricii TaxID=2872261 RepID=UPI001ED96B82|nr:uncharacterized protein LOC124178494 isoform X1 [Neodiprion fabricii]